MIVNQPNYLGGFLALIVGILIIWFTRTPPGPPTPEFPEGISAQASEAIVRQYRSFGETLQDGYDADRLAFLAFKEQQRHLAHERDVARAAVLAQGVGE